MCWGGLAVKRLVGGCVLGRPSSEEVGGRLCVWGDLAVKRLVGGCVLGKPRSGEVGGRLRTVSGTRNVVKLVGREAMS